VPTLAEMSRIKVWLLATRNTVRDYLDTVVLLERLGQPNLKRTFADFDEIYKQLSGASPLSEAVERLAAAKPRDSGAALGSYIGLAAPWNSWGHLSARGRHWAPLLAAVALGKKP
jgi:hypothetical protein